MLGIIGNLFLLLAFVGSVISLVAYYRSTRVGSESAVWLRTGRLSWAAATVVIFASAIFLWVAIFTHQFQYHYVWSNTSMSLSWYYLLSSFWAGQEGSFLLWIMYTSLIGFAIMAWNKDYESHVMTVIGLCQVFMISMIVGLKLGFFTLGSSPFVTLAERFPDAQFLQAGGVPPDGQGLNELLQNIWMAIHPPTMFSGFAAMIVPFAFAVTGLWTRRYTEWVRPALPWALYGNLILMSGILMGGYWAYVTLSFGGYWAWDPVENSSLVPWLVGVAGIHAMVAQKRSGTNHKAAIILNIVAFMLVVYSTFLTRSGILGDISVHSFVDLGLYNQLLLWILSMGVVGFGAFAYRYKELPTPKREAYLLSREFLIFTGAMLLCAMAAVIILGTSTPIIGRIFLDSPSGVPIEFYNKWTLPIAVTTAFVVGLGQLFWWTKMSVESVNRVLVRPLAAAVISTAMVLILTPFAEGTVRPEAIAQAGPEMIEAGVGASIGHLWSVYGTSILLLLLLFASFFAFYGNLIVLWRVGRGNAKLAGGAITHVGFAVMLFGILTSSGFTNALSDQSGPVRRADGTIGERQNFVIERGQTLPVEGYSVRYAGTEMTKEGHPAYLIEFADASGRSFTARAVSFKGNNDQWIQHPYVKSWFEKDLFVAVSPKEMFGESEEEEAAGTIGLSRGQTIDLSDTYAITFQEFEMDAANAHGAQNAQISVAARLSVTNKMSGESRDVEPVYIILEDRSQHFEPAEIADWGLTIAFTGMSVDTGQIAVTVQGGDLPSAQPQDWVLVQAYEKPFINLLWFGSFIMLGGFGIAMARRISEQKEAEKREKERNQEA